VASHHELSNFIWRIADLLRRPYHQPQYEPIVLPMTVLREIEVIRRGAAMGLPGRGYPRTSSVGSGSSWQAKWMIGFGLAKLEVDPSDDLEDFQPG
jgi:hypothetical protein